MSQQQSTPEWLRRTQERSWEPEILISGIVLLALTQVPRLLDQLHYFLEERTAMFWFYTANTDDVVIALLKTSSYWLIAGLITHLVMRSVWVSFVGLSYAYPRGIQLEKLKLKPWFENRLSRLPDFEASVVRLENICSSLYAVAFMLVMVTLSACFYGVFMIFLAVVLGTLFPNFAEIPYALDYSLLGFTVLVALPYFIDFLTLGWLKRIRGFWKVYRPVYVFMSWITLAGVYRGIYYGLVTNLHRGWTRLALISFVVLSFMLVGALDRSTTGIWGSGMIKFEFGTSTYDGYYRDQSPPRYSTWAHIQSATIENNTLELFLPHKVQFEKFIQETCEANLKLKGDSSKAKDDIERNHQCMTAFYNIYIDGEPADPQQFLFRRLYATEQVGVFAWLDISHLPAGMHELSVHCNFPIEKDQHRAQIPFFKTNQ